MPAELPDRFKPGGIIHDLYRAPLYGATMPADSDLAHAFDPIKIGPAENVCNKCGGNELAPQHHGWTKHELLIERTKELARRYAEDSMQGSVLVLSPGTIVRVEAPGSGEDYLMARVEQSTIRMGNAIWYWVSWWNGRDRKEDWVHSSEVKPVQGSPSKTRVGFHDAQGSSPPDP